MLLQSRQFNSFLWALERDPPVYFFGTIHVPYTEVWDHIPANSEQAFYESQNIYFELDLTDPVTLDTLGKCQVLPEGTMLREVIPRNLFKRIRRHLVYIKKVFPKWMTREQQLRFDPAHLYSSLTKHWRKKRPIWIMLMLNTLNEYDTKSRGISVLDTFLIGEAVRNDKKKGSIESVEEQCGPLNSLNNSQVRSISLIYILHVRAVMFANKRAKLFSLVQISLKEMMLHFLLNDHLPTYISGMAFLPIQFRLKSFINACSWFKFAVYSIFSQLAFPKTAQ